MARKMRNFVIHPPKVGTTVEVHGVERYPFSAVVLRYGQIPWAMVNVRRLRDGKEYQVPWAQVTHWKKNP